MICDHYSPRCLLIVIQLIGLLGLVLVRGSMGSRYRGWLQTGFFACLLVVAGVMLLNVGRQNTWSLLTGTTFAVMVVGATAVRAE